MLPKSNIIFFFIYGLLGFILWIKMNDILERNNKKASFFWVTPGPFLEFIRLIKEEKDQKSKWKYRALLWAQIALAVLHFLNVFVIND